MSNYKVPKGCVDIIEDVYKWQWVESKIQDLMKVYGYQEIRTPIFEHTNVFCREMDSSDMVNKEMYTFNIHNRSLTLRPEGTAGVVRSFVENKLYANPIQPTKLYYYGPMFRYENPQKGRQRMFHQLGVEVFGLKNALLDSEVIAMGYHFLQDLGLNDLKVLLNSIGDEQSRKDYKEALKKYLQPHLSHLCEDCSRRYHQNPLRILDCKVNTCRSIIEKAPSIKDYLNEESATYFNEVCTCLETLNVNYEIDYHLVRGLDYYSDTVFEIVSTDEQMGAQSTILAGGRYDQLVSYYQGPKTCAVGFGMGVERLIIALDNKKLIPVQEENSIYVMCLSNSTKLASLQLVEKLRKNGYVARMDFELKSMKAQFRMVERFKSKIVVFLGEKEQQEQIYAIKNIVTQQKENIPQSDLLMWLKEEFKNA